MRLNAFHSVAEPVPIFTWSGGQQPSHARDQKHSEVAAGSLLLWRLTGNRSIGMKQPGLAQILPQCRRDRVA
jgi:hypothetical protein